MAHEAPPCSWMQLFTICEPDVLEPSIEGFGRWQVHKLGGVISWPPFDLYLSNDAWST